VYAATCEEKPIYGTDAEYEPLCDGVNAYQTVPADWPYPQEGVGSPGSTVAAVVSTLSLNGSALTAVASAKLSFDGGGTTAIER
jgi:hypothetical protein